VLGWRFGGRSRPGMEVACLSLVHGTRIAVTRCRRFREIPGVATFMRASRATAGARGLPDAICHSFGDRGLSRRTAAHRIAGADAEEIAP
jgi:hypothetical protein